MSGVNLNLEIATKLLPTISCMNLANGIDAIAENKWIRAAANTVLAFPAALFASLRQNSPAIATLALLPVIITAAEHLAKTNGKQNAAYRLAQGNEMIRAANKIVALALSIFALAIAISTGSPILTISYTVLTLINSALLGQYLRASPLKIPPKG